MSQSLSISALGQAVSGGNSRERFEATIAALGRPFYRDDHSAVFHGDSFDLLEAVPRASIDLCVTSPPYNIGKEYEAVMALDSYIEWSGRWIEKVHRASCASGSFWLNLGYISIPGQAKAIPLPYLLWNKIPFYLMQEVVWNYGAGVSAKHSFSPRNEKFLWYVKDPQSYTFNLDDVRDPDVKYPNQMKNGKLRCNPLGKNPTDVWAIPKVTSGKGRASAERTSHPAQFPVAVIDRVIRASSNEDDIILDPFLGSGSSIVSASKSNRLSIGIEIRKDYAEIARDRIKSERTQPNMI